MAQNTSTLDSSTAVAAEIRAEMARQQISVRNLAERLGWPVSSTARRLRAEQALTIDDLALIARTLDVPLQQLIPRTAA